MKHKEILKLLLIAVVLIGGLAATILYAPQFINLGLDLQGGIHVVMQAVPDEGEEVTDEQMESLSAVMTERINSFGLAEPLIQREGKDRLIIELAGITDADEAMETLGKTAKLEFLDPDGNVILSGSELEDAQASMESGSSNGVIYLTFSAEGAKKFAEATEKFIGKVITVELDGENIQTATVNEAIPNGKASISGNMTYDDAAKTASLLRSGALPVNVEVIEQRTVGPQLGADSLSKSYVAMVYGVVAVFLFMILYYRLPGLLTCLSLVLYGIIVIWVMIGIKATITLPGIAAFLLSIGMAVDANVIIFERVKDELRHGKTLSASIRFGFHRALKAIIDANITTLLVTAVLFYFGQALIKGFAITLSIGILTSMLTAIFFTRYLMNLAASDSILSKISLYRS